MQISEGQIGRVFVLRLDDGDKLPDCVEHVARERNIESATVLLVGGAKDGTLVVGPEETSVESPNPVTEHFQDASEILGVGTIFPSDEGPMLHMHASCGRGREVLTGCTRTGIHTFLVAEVVVMEITGVSGTRSHDPVSGFKLLNLQE